MRTLFTTLLVGFVLCGCTMLYTREYVVEPVQKRSAQEQEEIFSAFRDFLVKKGLSPLQAGQSSSNNRVAFKIGGSSAGFGLRRDYEDILEVTYSLDKGIRLLLLRIVHRPADFSDEYLKKFVDQTEAFILEATSKQVRVKLVSVNRA